MRNTVNHVVIKKVSYRKSYDIPTVLSANVRTIASKVDEIQQIAELNNANVICITETCSVVSKSISERSDKYNRGRSMYLFK